MGSISSCYSNGDTSPSSKKLKVSPFDAQDFDWNIILPNVAALLPYCDCDAAMTVCKTWQRHFSQKVLVDAAIESLIGKMMLHRIAYNHYDTYLFCPAVASAPQRHEKTWKRCIDAMDFIKSKTEMGDLTAHLAVSILAELFNLSRRNLTRAAAQQFYNLLEQPHLLTFVICFIASKVEDTEKLHPSHADKVFDIPVPSSVILSTESSVMQLLEDWLPIDYFGRYIIKLKSQALKLLSAHSDRGVYLVWRYSRCINVVQRSVNLVLSVFVRGMEAHHNALTAPPFMLAIAIILYAFLLFSKSYEDQSKTSICSELCHALLALDTHYQCKGTEIALYTNNA